MKGLLILDFDLRMGYRGTREYTGKSDNRSDDL